jgi:hypothetical protein
VFYKHNRKIDSPYHYCVRLIEYCSGVYRGRLRPTNRTGKKTGKVAEQRTRRKSVRSYPIEGHAERLLGDIFAKGTTEKRGAMS